TLKLSQVIALKSLVLAKYKNLYNEIFFATK
ncbi:hypothetical protein SAMN05216497_1391, partial [Clostridium cochlearium]